MSREERPDPSRPLKEVLNQDQIEFLRQNKGEVRLEKILNKSLKDILGSDDDPDIAQLLDRL